MTENSPDTWRATLKRRLALTGAVMALWSLVIVARLVNLQVFQFEDLTAKAEKRSSKERIPAKRGEIRDRNGELLTWSVDAPSIGKVPEAQRTVAVGDHERARVRHQRRGLNCVGSLTDSQPIGRFLP